MAGRHPEDVEPLEDELTDDAEAAEEDSSDEAEDGERSERVAAYWAALGIDPVEIALPRGGVGLTLREYRVVEAEPEIDDEELEAESLDAEALEAEDDTDDGPAADEDDDESRTRATAEDDDADADDDAKDSGDDTRPARDRRDREFDDKALAERFNADYADAELEIDDEDEDDDEPVSGRARVATGEEEAVFLATDGTLHLFRDAGALVAFVKSPAAHDLVGGEHWAELVETLTADLVVPDEEDRYELDLVVENLRGGRDVWEPDLIIGAGELARDLAYALDLTEVEASLASGSPLDDLDEALRAKGFFARRKLRRIGAEQAALAWRSVIGRISANVEWHG